MLNARVSFGVCVINNFIYAVGGMSTGRKVLDTVERYDILTNRWSYIEGAKLPLAGYSMSLHPV